MANAPRLSVVREHSGSRKLGRYELEERLGSDGGIETFRARVRGLAGFDRIFAVKCLPRRRGSTPANLNDPFIKTAKRSASITDPRVARVLDADVIDGTAIAVTEFVHGLDLDHFRECAQMTGVLATGVGETAEKWQKIVAYIGSEAAGGLSAMHALSPPLVHGGLVPRNILASARGGIKVVDIGLRLAAVKAGDASAPPMANYAAPELATSEASPASDVRSLGIILFELATGELPTSSDTSLAAKKVLDALWPAQADFFARMLADDPAVRPGASEIAKTLVEYWADIPDASMVAEMTALVRNFSAFVAEAVSPKTSEPLSTESSNELMTSVSSSGLLPVALSDPEEPAPTSRSTSLMASGSYLLSDEAAAVTRQTGSFADLLLQARPTEPAMPRPPQPSDGPGLFAEAENTVPQEAREIVAIPELADWGAQALAALGEQAGVSIIPLPATSAPEGGDGAVAEESLLAPPPPVHDLVIEEASAFPSSLTVTDLTPSFSLSRNPITVPNSARRETLAGPPVAEGLLVDSLLEDDLIDDSQALVPRAWRVLEQALDTAHDDDAPATDDPGVRLGEPPPVPEGEDQPSRDRLVASALTEEEGPSAKEEPGEVRKAQQMLSAEGDGRSPALREAQVSEAGIAVGAQSDEAWSNAPSPRRRIVFVVALVLGIGATAGGVAGWWSVKGRKPATLMKAVQTSSSSTALARSNPAPAGRTPPPVPSSATARPIAAAVAKPAEAQVGASSPLKPSKAAATPATSGGLVRLSVVSKPPGARVWIGGEEFGTTPVDVKVKPGKANMTLVRPGFRTFQAALDLRDGVTVEPELQAISPPMTGDARFRAECATHGKLPIVVDGKETGILCPYSKMRLDPGVHRIGVLVPALGKVHDKEITLKAGVRSIAFGD